MSGYMGLVGALSALAGLGVSVIVIDDEHQFRQSVGQVAEALEIKPKRRRPEALVSSAGTRRRSRGPQAPAKRQSNRVHISRRTRRKHRRAA